MERVNDKRQTIDWAARGKAAFDEGCKNHWARVDEEFFNQLASNVHTSIIGDSKITSFLNEDGNYCALIEPRPATAQEINDALSKIPGAIAGTFQGVNFIQTRKKSL